MRFFIAGLPRSRSAWFANYMSYGDTACLHDQFRHTGLNAGDLSRAIELTGATNVGHADSCNFLVAEELMELYPDSRWLVVRRDPAEAFKSLRVYAPEVRPSFILSMSVAMNDFIRRWEPMVVDFHNLTPAVIERAAKHLVPSWECPAWRTEMLCNMQVQLEPNFMKHEIEKAKGALWVSGLL